MCEDGCGVGFVCLHGLVTRWHGLYNLVANGNAQMGNGYDNVFIVIINLTCTLHCVIGLKTRGWSVWFVCLHHLVTRLHGLYT